MVINSDEWSALNAAQKRLFNTACSAGVTRNLARAEALQGPVIAAFPAKGVKAIRLPLPILRELNRVTDEVMAEEARNNEDFRTIRASQQNFRKVYARWKKLAYLPRDF